MTKLVVYALSAILACLVVGSLGANNDSGPKTMQLVHQIDLGSFASVDFYLNETTSKDGAELARAYFKANLNDKIFGTTLVYFKFGYFEKIFDCDALNLLDPRIEEHIECAPLDNLVGKNLDKESATTNISASGRYTYALSVKGKYKSSVGLDISKKNYFIGYPLDDGYILDRINNISTSNDIDDLNFNGYKSGFYFETRNPTRIQDRSTFMICRGEIYIAINGTKFSEGQGNKNLLEEALLMLDDSYNGYLFSVQNMDCAPEGIAPFSLAMNFTIAQRKQFPYLTVSHSIKTPPFEGIFNLESKVRQVLNETFTDAYNTSVHIVSRSAVPLLNFNLNQTFENTDSASGAEKMNLIFPGWTVVVDSLWNKSEFTKGAFLFYLNKTLNHLLSLTYNTKESDDFSTLAMRFQKNILESVIEQYFSVKSELGADHEDTANLSYKDEL